MMNINEMNLPGVLEVTPAAVLPEQYWATPRRCGEGERRLVLALIEEAIHTFQARAFAETPAQQDEFDEVHHWFRGDREAMISFEDACQMLGLDPQWLLSRLEEWREHRIRHPEDRPVGKIWRSRARTVRLVGRPAVNE